MLSNKFITSSAILLIAVFLTSTINANNIRNLNSVGWNDPFCSTWNVDGSCCLKCSYRSYMDKSGRCQAVSNYCKTWDEKNG